ncbi:hypothetical protein QCA50_010202 [Cerrena zonata]|uniref:Tubulin-specific chaperone A n=1 Tax=Cerrena zonata TaxID=2478898 RepID=A0AAW0G2J5_9APHY
MSDKATLHRQLRIKLGTTKRLFKEHKSYTKEAEDLQRKLDKFIADEAEAWDIKNTRNMMEESKKLIKDTDKRLGDAVQDLREVIATAEKNPEFAEDEEVLKAKEVLAEVSV